MILTVLLILSISSPSESLFIPIAKAGSNPELGLIAYIDLGSDINLYQARSVFSTIYTENADEIVGTYSFYTDNYNTETVNLYITSDGFISVYYWDSDPASKIISWGGEKTVYSKFATALSYIGQSLGYNIEYQNIKYYDYRYPNANKMLITTQSVGESNVGGYDYGNLEFNIPNGATVYEISYSLYLNDAYNSQSGSNIAIDTTMIDSIAGNGVIYNYYDGYVSKGNNHLLGVMSTQGAQSGVAMVIIYKDPMISINNADNYFDGTLDDPYYLDQNTPTYSPSYTPVYTPAPTQTRTPIITVPFPTVGITDTPASGGNTPVQTTQAPLRPSTASVNLYGEKTDVELGENILLKLSAVSLITKPKMHVQVIIIPPSGMSVTSSEFVKSGAGQYTTTYELEPGNGRDIEIRIISNQVGEFKVIGRIVYYFGDDVSSGEDHSQELTIKVRSKGSGTSSGQTDQTGNTPEKETGLQKQNSESGNDTMDKIITGIIITAVAGFIGLGYKIFEIRYAHKLQTESKTTKTRTIEGKMTEQETTETKTEEKK